MKDYFSSINRKEIKDAINELNSVVNSGGNENKVQKFLEKNVFFLCR